MRRRGGKPTPVADILLEPAVHRQSAPVGVVGREQGRLLVIALGANRLGHDRLPAVGADDDGGPFDDGGSVLRAAL
jgi:hypothetical protein